MFDKKRTELLKKIKNSEDKEKLQQIKPSQSMKMSLSMMISDNIERTVIVTIYLILTFLISGFLKFYNFTITKTLVELFLFSTLNSYYCYDYKAQSYSLLLDSSLQTFIAQWEYNFGFGFLFSLFLMCTKEIGSSLFFLGFPLYLMISLDDEGASILYVLQDRISSNQIPKISLF